jgi:hypothetical protein
MSSIKEKKRKEKRVGHQIGLDFDMLSKNDLCS